MAATARTVTLEQQIAALKEWRRCFPETWSLADADHLSELHDRWLDEQAAARR